MKPHPRERLRPRTANLEGLGRNMDTRGIGISACVLTLTALVAAIVLVLVLLGGRSPRGSAAPLPPVYITIVSHNEEPLGGRPDYTADVNYYLQNRAILKSFAETITSRGATLNFESDWNYLQAVAMYDVGSVTSGTNGKNIVRWMKEDLGVEVDPHAHETQYNYADVAYLIEQLGVVPSKNVGGFLYDPPDNGQGWEQHEAGINGWIYPSYFWRADNLWGAGTSQHQGNDDKSSGVWRPQDRYNFYVDDPAQRLLYIGGCNGSRPLLQQVLTDIESGAAPAGGFYTADLGYAQDWLTQQSIADLGAFIDSLAPYVAQGRVQWVTLTEMANLWRTQYGSQPFRYDCTTNFAGTPTPTPPPVQTPTGAPSSYTTESLETWVTAPNGNRVYTRIVQPDDALYPGQRFPALVAIPGGTGAGAPLAGSPAYRGLAAQGFVIVSFNPEGRGNNQPGNLKSEGAEDCNGFLHQDDLKAVIEYAAALPNVDATNIGVETSSFGIAIGAGALGRYPDLPVAYLVDQEGPHDNRVITFYDAGRELAVCGHLSTVTDPSAANVAYWTEREAVRYIGAFKGRYLRMQAEVDHAQNHGYYRHTIDMINAATHTSFGGAGDAVYTRVNGSDIGNAVNAVYPPGQNPIWVTGRLSDHPGLSITYDLEMAAMAADVDSDGLENLSDPDDENDGFFDPLEAASPLCGDGRNEDDGDDSLTDDGCPGGPPQAGAYSEAGFNIGTRPQDPCGTDGWPLDFVSGGIPDSTNRVTITDLTSFLAPERRLGTSPGVAGFDSRWDLAPGKGLFTSWIAINDLTALLSGQTGNPPMLGGARAFNGPACPWAP